MRAWNRAIGLAELLIALGSISPALAQVVCVGGGCGGSGLTPLSATTSVGSLAVAGGTNCLAVQGRYAYNCESGVLRIYDVGGSAPVLVSAVTSSVTTIKMLAVQGRYAYTYGISQGVLDVIDISNPTTPTKVGSVTAGSTTSNFLAVQGRYAYTYSGGAATLYVIDVSVPTAPVIVSSTTGLSIGAANGNFSVQGRYLYAPGSSSTLKVIDISDPAAPAGVGSVSGVGTTLQSAIVQGRYVYAGSANGLSVIDVIDPANPSFLATVAVGGTACYYPVAVGNYVYCEKYATPGALITIDVSTPASPTIVDTFATNRIYRIAALGGYVYVAADDGNGVQIIKPVGAVYPRQINTTGPIDGGGISSRGDVTARGDVRAEGAGVFSRGVNATGPSGLTSIVVGENALTAATMTQEIWTRVRTVTSSFTWTNAQVVALGASLTGDIKVVTLPAKTRVKNAYVVITGQGAGTTTLTVALGRTSASYIDYIVASDAQAAANTVYGDASGERGANLTEYDLPSYTATTDVYCHFISTGSNLSAVTGSTGRVVLETELVP